MALIGLVAIAAWGCGPSAAELHFEGALASHPEARLVLVATKQKERIRASLLEAGLGLSDEMLEADFYLRVTVGNEKAFRACGTLNNVEYELLQRSARVLTLTAAGWTGRCEPNVFDEMSGRLATALAQGSEAAAPRDAERE